MDTTILISFRDVFGTRKAYPMNHQAERLARIAKTMTLTQETLATAMQMGFEVKVVEDDYHYPTGKYRPYTEQDVRNLA